MCLRHRDSTHPGLPDRAPPPPDSLPFQMAKQTINIYVNLPGLLDRAAPQTEAESPSPTPAGCNSDTELSQSVPATPVAGSDVRALSRGGISSHPCQRFIAPVYSGGRQDTIPG